MGRDKHELRRRRSKRRFVQIWHEVIESPAYQSLSVHAKATLVELCNRYNGVNNGRIPLSQREIGQRLRTGQHQAFRAMKDLAGHGLAIPERAGWFSPNHCHSTEWRITFQATDKPATNEFRNWKPASDAGAASLAQVRDEEPKKQNADAGAASPRCRSGITSATAKMNDRCRSGITSEESTDAGAASHVHSSQGVHPHTAAADASSAAQDRAPDPRMPKILAAAVEMVADGKTNEQIFAELDHIDATLAAAGCPLPSSARREVARAIAAARPTQTPPVKPNARGRAPAHRTP
jgi:hypothetical protein